MNIEETVQNWKSIQGKQSEQGKKDAVEEVINNPAGEELTENELAHITGGTMVPFPSPPGPVKDGTIASQKCQ